MTATQPCLKKLTKSDNPKPYYEFNFEFKNGSVIDTHKEFLFPSMCAPLLRALKCKETEAGIFDWDKEEIVGRKIEATISHIPDKKDTTKMKAVIISAMPIEEELIPF